MVVLALFGVLALTYTSNIKELENPLANTAHSLSHQLRLIRARAISQTTYMRVAPTSTGIIAVSKSTSCTSSTLTAVADLKYTFDSSVHLNSTSWSICFTPRGLANSHVTFTFTGATGTKTVDVALGGGTRIL